MQLLQLSLKNAPSAYPLNLVRFHVIDMGCYSVILFPATVQCSVLSTLSPPPPILPPQRVGDGGAQQQQQQPGMLLFYFVSVVVTKNLWDLTIANI
jgi:hypothetical protein